MSGNEEAIKQRGSPQQVGTEAQVSEGGDGQHVWVNTMANTGKRAKPVTPLGWEPTEYRRVCVCACARACLLACVNE